RRVNPWTPTKDLSDTDLHALYNTAQQAMTSNLNTTDRNRTFPGYGPAAVHGRGGRPCRRCGTRIKVRSQGELARLTYWCPACQPGPER
ncbi:MAG: DNA glycosylase, partial [Chloroflexi bacterium]